jgi:hypothetical protein
MSLNKIRFYFIRLLRSSAAEMLYRVEEMFLLFFLKNFPVIFQRSLACPEIDPEVIKNLRLPSVCGNIDTETVGQLLHGKVFCLGHEQQELICFEKKHRETFFSKVSCQADDPDVRAVWETGRLQHLMLLMTFLKTEESESKRVEIEEFVKTNLLKWINDNSFLYGPHYMSVMECGLRVPVFLQALYDLEELNKEEQNKIYQAIYQHGWLIRKRLSLYSSLGNHTVTECLGLVMAGALFSNDFQGREWLNIGIRLLEQEAEHLILSDGGPMEQSLNYHRFVLDLYWLAVDFLKKNNLHDCSRLKNRLQLGETFLKAFLGPDGSVPAIGDSDDGYAVAPGLHPEYVLQDSTVLEEIKTFPTSGYTVIHNGNGLRLTFDHGPLGMPPLYNHGHADGLSMTLSLGEHDFLIDPGTYQYNGDAELRTYFKGTRAHNTVCVDEENQAEQLTGFIWDKPYNIEWTRKTTPDGYEVIRASHDGYKRLPHPVIHQRRLVYEPSAFILVEDSFRGTGRHNFALHFHLHPDVLVEQDDSWYHLKNNGRKLCLQVMDGQFDQVKGRKGPLLGWFSPAYGTLEETTTLHIAMDGESGEVSFITLIGIDNVPDQETISRIMKRP